MVKNHRSKCSVAWSYCSCARNRGGFDEDGCAGATQILAEKKSLSQEFTVHRRKNEHILEQTYVSLPNKRTQVRF